MQALVKYSVYAVSIHYRLAALLSLSCNRKCIIFLRGCAFSQNIAMRAFAFKVKNVWLEKILMSYLTPVATCRELHAGSYII